MADYNSDFKKMVDDFSRQQSKVYRDVFSNLIKENFLITMVNRIEYNPAYYLHISNNFHGINLESTLFGKNKEQINLCKMIVMAHYNNVVRLTDSEKGTLQKSEEYKKKLTDQVINMVLLEKSAASDFASSSIEGFLPLIYYTSALNNHLAYYHNEMMNGRIQINVDYDKDFNLRMLYKIIFKVNACIRLADGFCIDELAVIFRTLVETYMTYVALWDEDKTTIDYYYELDGAAFTFNSSSVINEKYRIQAKENKSNPIKYINYGWIKNLREFDTIKQAKNKIDFSLSALADILDKKYENISDSFGKKLYRYFKGCNPQTHSTSLIMNYFEFELYIFINLASILGNLCEIFLRELIDIKYNVQGIDLLEEIFKIKEDSQKIFEYLNNNDKKLEQTNNDYRNRALFKMRINN